MSANAEPLPLALYHAAAVRDLDERLIACGTPGRVLMQRAAQALWQALRRRWPSPSAITVLAGSGNNAGDGFLLAVLAQQYGIAVQVLTACDPAVLRGDAASAFAAAQAAGVPIAPWQPGCRLQGVVVDALLGTGLRGEVRAPLATLIHTLNASGLPVLAVDVPSGLCADSGRVLGCAVRAELTVTFIGLKLGLFQHEGIERRGALVLADLEADPLQVAATPVAAWRLAGEHLPRLPARGLNSHKGQFGRLLVVGGDSGTGGAALLAAESALRGGAGLVTLATRAEHLPAALARRPEVMCRGVRSGTALQPRAAAAAVLVLGPGIGQGAWARSLLGSLARVARPQVWDADALNLLASGALRAPEGAWIATPHPGEAARLLGVSVSEVQQDRARAARALAERLQAVVVLKGAGTLVALPQGELYLCDRGHPAMAGAGFGDVLAGLLGALLAQGLPVAEAARLGVWLHAVAGERLAVAGRGLAAGELSDAIRQVLEEHSPCLR